MNSSIGLDSIPHLSPHTCLWKTKAHIPHHHRASPKICQNSHYHTKHLLCWLWNAYAPPPASSFAPHFCCRGNVWVLAKSCEPSATVVELIKSVIWPLSVNEAQSKSHDSLFLTFWCSCSAQAQLAWPVSQSLVVLLLSKYWNIRPRQCTVINVLMMWTWHLTGQLKQKTTTITTTAAVAIKTTSNNHNLFFFLITDLTPL